MINELEFPGNVTVHKHILEHTQCSNFHCMMQMLGCAMGLDRGHCCRSKMQFETSILGYRQLCLIRGISK
jgi:hypothetical protein